MTYHVYRDSLETEITHDNRKSDSTNAYLAAYLNAPGSGAHESRAYQYNQLLPGGLGRGSHSNLSKILYTDSLEEHERAHISSGQKRQGTFGSNQDL